jgi:hypothetical protein
VTLRRLAPTLLVTLLLAGVTNAPYLRAALAPPPGSAFLGFFFWVEDMYHYLSFVEQAERGSFVFENKVLLTPHEPALVNLEWWLVGRISALVGNRPALAYRLFGLLATLALVAAADRWLRLAGLPDRHRLGALLLVTCGAGLGGVRYLLAGPPAWRSLDLVTGLFPFIELLCNPHFVAGTSLLAWGLLALLHGGTRATLGFLAIGTILGLSRPYDVVSLGAIRLMGLALGARRVAWARELLPLAGLGPVAAYNAWLFYESPGFAVLSRFPYVFPPVGDFLLALGPAAALALLVLRYRPAEAPARAALLHLVAWVLWGLLLLVLQPVSFTLQFLAGYGFPLLALAALGLSRFRAEATLAASIGMASTALVALSIVARPEPRWFVPAERLEAVQALREVCRPGDVALTTPEIGLYAIGLTPCRAYASYPVSEGYAERKQDVSRFYNEKDPVWRAGLLDRACVAHVLLPGDAGAVPEGWLGPQTRFQRTASVGGEETVATVYSGALPASCRQRAP